MIKEEFNKIHLLLNTRKSCLLTELRANREVYAANIAKAIENIKEKKKDLETKAVFAKSLLESPSLTTYCYLDQIVADLKVTFENDCLVPDTLKLCSHVRFNINNDIVKVFEEIGEICSGKFANENIVLSIDNSQCHHDLPETRKSKKEKTFKSESGIVQEFKAEQAHLLCSEAKHTAFQELGSSASQNLVAFVTHSLSDPDVIIEEIIEEHDDDQASKDESQSFGKELRWKCEHVMRELKKEAWSDKQRSRKCSQKRPSHSLSFGQKRDLQENVYLTHVINPCNFFVHRLSEKKHFIMFERMLGLSSNTSSPCSPNDILVLGEIIAFKSTEQNSWCRGKITELIPLESKYVGKPYGPTKYKIEDVSLMTVFLLDYGTSEVFIASRLLQQSPSNLEELEQLCLNKSQWLDMPSCNCKVSLQSIAYKKFSFVSLLIVFVSLLRFAGAHISKNENASVCHTLTNDFCQILRKLHPDSELSRMPPFALQCSLVDIVPQNSDECWTKEAKDEFIKMAKKKCVTMKVFREEDNKFIVDLRKPPTNKTSSGMPVSLRDALVFLELARFRSQVPVAELNREVMQYVMPKKPKNKTEVNVIVCHMNDPSDFYIHVLDSSEYLSIVNKIQKVYNDEDAEDFEILYPVIGQPCIAKYEDEDWYRAEVIGLPGNQEVDVKYVDFGNVARVSIRKLRKVKGEFLRLPCQAICCRLAFIQPCNTQEWSREARVLFESMVADKRLKCTAIGILLDDKLSVELFEVDNGNPVSINAKLVEEKVASFISGEHGSSKYRSCDREVWDPVSNTLSGPNQFEERMNAISLLKQRELDVRVSYVESPSRIFVQWLSTEHLLKSLQVTMCQKYENTQPEKIQWCVEMYVAVKPLKEWKRGIIKNIISETLVEVFFYDFGNREVTDINNIRLLDESVKTYGTMCLECSLMDIQPAGGSQNWTATACDVLSYYLTGAVVTMVIKENASKWPLPVKMECKDEVGHLVDISDFLIKKGLALKERKFGPNKPEAVSEASEDTQTLISVEQSINEPIPERVAELTQEHTLSADIIDNPETCEPLADQDINEPYLPPLIPDAKLFSAKVSHVAEDGIIYVIPKSLENDLDKLMRDIQKSFRGLGLLAPYCWKTGEGCFIKGSDGMSYRGKVLQILGGDTMMVRYEDFGYTEKIPKCHLYPTVFNPNIPRFCIPCQLHNILPVGEVWQSDAIQLLRELLTDRHVDVQLVDPPKFPGAVASVYLYCDKASVSAILEQYAHCVPEDNEKRSKIERMCIFKDSEENSSDCEMKDVIKVSLDNIFPNCFQDLVLSTCVTPLLPAYTMPSLPHPGELFPVSVTHIQTPNVMFISVNVDSENHERGSGVTLESCLQMINLHTDELLPLTDFRSEMPCLARYSDGQLYRAKLQSVGGYDPVSFVVEFVDYGSTAKVDTKSLFQIPVYLIKYPAKVVKVRMAGFKPPVKDFEMDRIPYCHEWSLKALYMMMDLLHEKSKLFASHIATTSQEVTVFLYDENQQLVYKPLISVGLADLC
ncbi:RING finger protein 17 [Spea bombifrons]|uniref:RING finger protein 17 n=1 Tax=Spea bombifrons TaxID=233779 RepID=UPI00234BF3CB|nr:RING finger protein 17 [Spea bombifrons]